MSSPKEEIAATPGQLVIARLERLDVWSLSYVFIGIIGLGFLFTFYDIFDINVSFIQTCVALKPGCTPENALEALPYPVVLNLAGYVVGTLVLSPYADKVGRRNMLLITMLITGLGSLYNALAPGYVNFNIARIITGIGIGADLAIVNTYINEVAPRRARAKFTTIIFIMSALGAFVGIWLGLILTTPATPWPQGLPFAVAGPGFANGWRWMYGVGAILALVAILLRVQLPESPRWLIGQGRVEEADEVVSGMESRAIRHGALREPVPADAAAVPPPPSKVPYRDLFTSPLYLRRILLLFAIWFIGYITVYSYASGFTSILVALHFSPPAAGVIAAVGTIGFVGEAVVMSFLVEKLERRYWLPIGAAVTIIGALLIATAGTTITISFIGAILIFAGFNMWVSPTYALSAESFPTRARTTGFALVDGVGHIGGGIGVLVIAPFLPHMSVLGAFMLITVFIVVASILVQFTPHTRNRPLDAISP
ncbi:MFS transporter [Arthrobacter sp. SDTb3-6]|uniref:MFS transporter n=1 Tax=Arthrobacter sp. SDTb3-6 TaxID=2713571 RepID=UPI00159D7BB9|nr:MFS transporter [Arthrobacter sp. SDTb3-6]NVM99454.1 MFS transporter [Arthrobacter sp. SDTb3-6]